MIGYNDVISFFRNTQWLIGIVPSVITFFTARWLFNRKVLQELSGIKNAISPTKYTGETWFEWRNDGIFSNGGASTCNHNFDVTSPNIIHVEEIATNTHPTILFVEHHPIITRKHNRDSPMVQDMKNSDIIMPCGVQSSGEHYSILTLRTDLVKIQVGQKYKITF
jgi:hypothetical protein